MKLFGLPVLGLLVPWITRRKLALNADGSFVDTGIEMIEDEVGPYYVRPAVLEWLGFGIPLSQSLVYRTADDEPVDAPWGDGPAGRG
ncbi:hypothetical protein NS230_13680 [Methylobacterium indicum]|uniref:hypothetical protein n=1 Tax=Methylobacterium indicum TaxID=1775910 RepID=UPI000733EE6A|nr:hypothetical protein [Methylobacterium indicum]KTS51397.1 hypothetical protein NS230_13680 [Methylobacterium indicum]